MPLLLSRFAKLATAESRLQSYLLILGGALSSCKRIKKFAYVLQIAVHVLRKWRVSVPLAEH